MDAVDEVGGVDDHNERADDGVHLDQPKISNHSTAVGLEVVVDGAIEP